MQFWTNITLQNELKKCVADVGEIIMDIYQSGDYGVQTKSDESPLTKADKAAHNAIVSKLQSITPNIPIISEEDTTSQSQANANPTFWLVDPLDGTKEFIQQTGEFTVNIALIHNGIPVFGIVGIPAQDLIYWGGMGLGAFRATSTKLDTEITELRCRSQHALIRVVASKSHMNEETQSFISALGETELVQAGSSLKFLKIAENEADIYPRLGPTCEWDTAAAQAVLEGAGGVVTQLCGKPMRYGKDNPLNPYFVARKSYNTHSDHDLLIVE